MSASAPAPDFDLVGKCCAVMKNAKTDEQKLAALMLVGKLKTNIVFDKEGKKRLLDAISFRFIRRLINCRSVSEECDLDAHKAVAFAVLSFFASEDSGLIGTEELCQILPGVKQLLSDRAGYEEIPNHEQVIEDCFQCIIAVIKVDPTKEYLATYILPMLSNICLEATATIYSRRALFTLTTWLGLGGWSHFDDVQLSMLLAAFTHQFTILQDESKFSLCDSIYAIITSVYGEWTSCEAFSLTTVPLQDHPSVKAAHEIDTGPMQKFCTEYADRLLGSLMDLLQNKLGVAQKQSALKLVTCLVLLRGPDKMLELPSGTKKLLLLVNLVSIEVRLGLDSAADLRLSEPIQDIMCCSFQLMEQVIFLVVKEQSPIDQAEDILNAHKAISEAVSAVYKYFEGLHDEEQLEMLDVKTMAAMYGMVRFIGAWLSEETSAHTEHVASILPSLTMLSRFSLSHGQDIFKFLLPGLQPSLDYSNVQEAMLSCVTFMTDYFKYLMAILKNGHEQAEYQKILCHWCALMLDAVQTDVLDFEVEATVYQNCDHLLELLLDTYPSLIDSLRSCDSELSAAKQYEVCLAVGAVCCQMQCFMEADYLTSRQSVLTERMKEFIKIVASFNSYIKCTETSGSLLCTWLDSLDELRLLSEKNPQIVKMLVDDERFIPSIIEIGESTTVRNEGANSAIDDLLDVLVAAKDETVKATARTKVTPAKD